MRDVDNSQDILDSRDIDKRIEELESSRDDWQTDNELPDYIDPETTTDDSIKAWTDEQVEKWAEWDESDEGQELKALIAFRDELKPYVPDWNYGESLIRDSYFTEYCEELVKDIGILPASLPAYIERNIDWDGVAEDLQADYGSAELDGVTYWGR